MAMKIERQEPAPARLSVIQPFERVPQLGDWAVFLCEAAALGVPAHALVVYREATRHGVNTITAWWDEEAPE